MKHESDNSAASSIWLPSNSILDKIVSNDKLDKSQILEGIACGELSLLCSKSSSQRPNFNPIIVGNYSRKKTCVAIGMDTNSVRHLNNNELSIIMNASPDAVCDVSIGKNITEAVALIRNQISVPLGSCPTYDILNEKVNSKITREYMIDKIESHMKTGIDFILVHMGFSRDMLNAVLESNRVMPTTSRGGGAVLRYMKMTGNENPFIEYLDDILKLCLQYEVVLDIGDVFRSGCLEDGCSLTHPNSLKFQEVTLLSVIQQKAFKAGVQVVCEAGGHVPLDKIQDFVIWLKKVLHNAPIFFNGPLPTDRAIGLDSTANAIGVAYAAIHGGDMFLALTDAEHYAKPTPLQSSQAIRDMKVAISSVEYSIGNKKEIQLNHCMGKERQDRNWGEQANLSLYPNLTKNLFFENNLSRNSQPCSLCGPMCPLLVNHAAKNCE